VISVITTHSGASPDEWRAQPDVVIERPSDIIQWLKV